MQVRATSASDDPATLDDHALVAMVLAGHRDAFRHIMQRCNQRLFRVARSVVRNDTEAEDVLQESYLHAYRKLNSFHGDAALLTWLTSIVLNEARSRLRKRRNLVDLDQVDQAPDDSHVVAFRSRSGSEDPMADAAREQMRRLLERAIGALPPAFRTVYMLREIEGCSVEETAAQLDLNPATVKTRLFRARSLLRDSLRGTFAGTLDETFLFMGERCERLSNAVMARLESELATRPR
jgi:RNA polymerase sigma-70 factor (ECF subfamily)